MESTGIPPGVGRTALGVARIRAWESGKPDRLFDDPYAAAFTAAGPTVGSRGRVAPGSSRARLVFHVVMRTRFYDDYLLAAGHRQVVLLAAGLDTRAYRLPWPPGVRVYELDLPEMLAFKDRVLADRAATPRCERTALPVDLREDWPAALTDAGFDPAEPTAWLVEGLLVYLSDEEAARLLTRVGELSAPGSRLSFERTNAASVFAADDRADLGDYTSLWRGGLGEDAVGWLDRHGWRTEVHGLADVAASYGRPLPDGSLSGFLTATYEG